MHFSTPVHRLLILWGGDFYFKSEDEIFVIKIWLNKTISKFNTISDNNNIGRLSFKDTYCE